MTRLFIKAKAVGSEDEKELALISRYVSWVSEKGSAKFPCSLLPPRERYSTRERSENVEGIVPLVTNNEIHQKRSAGEWVYAWRRAEHGQKKREQFGTLMNLNRGQGK